MSINKNSPEEKAISAVEWDKDRRTTEMATALNIAYRALYPTGPIKSLQGRLCVAEGCVSETADRDLQQLTRAFRAVQTALANEAAYRGVIEI